MNDTEEETQIKKDLHSPPHDESGEELKYSEILVKKEDLKFDESQNMFVEGNCQSMAEIKPPILTSLVKDCSVLVCRSDVSLYINKIKNQETDLKINGEDIIVYDFGDSQQNETESDEDDCLEKGESEEQEGDYQELAGLKRIPKKQSGNKSRVKKKYFKERKFVCRFCNKGFTQSDILRRHIRTHTGERPHECSYCWKRFISKAKLKIHMTLHTGKRFRCSICDKRFVQSQGLKTHMLIHEGKKPYKCSFCKQEFRQKSGLLRHLRRFKDHDQSNKDLNSGNGKSSERLELQQTSEQHDITDELGHFKCADCGKIFKSKQSVMVHISLFHPVERYEITDELNNFECADCGKIFQSKDSITEHINRVHPVERIRYCCKICGTTFKSKKNQKLHERLHEDIYPFKCDICKMSFKRKINLKSHFIHLHESEKPFKCADCGKTFKVKNNLKAHIEVHHNQSGAIFKCNICLMEFKRECYLKRHSQTHTGADKIYACHICSIRCRSKTDIMLHVRTHANAVVKNHACDICDARFAKPSHLVRHKRVHSDEKIFRCQLCHKAYKDSTSLKIHHETVHCEATFSCQECGWSSTNRHSFNRHLRNCCV